MSMFAVGGLFGGLGSGPVVSALGLRVSFAINNVILIAAALMMALAPSIQLFTAGRFVVGVGSGVTTVRHTRGRANNRESVCACVCE